MKISRYRHLLDTAYPAVRRVMHEDLQEMDDDALEEFLEDLFPGIEPDDVENFMRTLQRFGRQAAPIAQRALPGIVQGAVQGGSVGGPWGALAGALGGGAASLLSGGRTPATPPRQTRTTPTPPRPAPGAPANPALAQLLFLLSRPETMQALSSLLMSSSGRGVVRVGSVQAPALAFANAISETAAQVVESYETTPEDGILDYLLDAQGNPRGDVFNPTERARLLLEDLASIAAAEAADESVLEVDDFEEVIDDEWIDADDPLDAYESALEGKGAYDD